MSTFELRLSLIEQLTKIDDETLLTQTKNLILRSSGKMTETEKRNPAQMTLGYTPYGIAAKKNPA